MEILRHENAAAFLAAAGPYLREHETTNHLVFAIAERDPQGAFFATAGSAGVALQTPPYPLLVSELPESALDPLIETIVASGFAPTGVNGSSATSRAFASRWCARNGMRAAPRITMRSHVLERVMPAGRAPGMMRPARDGDLELATRWCAGFQSEIRSSQHEAPAALAGRLLPRLFFWEHHGETVSMAAINGLTPRGRRIGPVYTPPEHRQRGYAEALVAVLSQSILDEGLRWCFLFTDVANPTANAIYRRIGYEPNGEIEEIAFA